MNELERETQIAWDGREHKRQLRQAYSFCKDVARSKGRNFYYSFLVLPRRQRLAMCALYTFMRRTDDLGDSVLPVEVRRSALSDWRTQLNQVLADPAWRAGSSGDTWWLAFRDTVERNQVPATALHAVIDGVASDLDRDRYESFTDLYQYCYRVASAVGLACIRIWGVTDPRADLPAEWCGIAFQLTNVLRDVAEDQRRGRIYLPQEDLARFDVTERDLMQCEPTPAFEALMRFQIQRAHNYYDRALRLMDYLPPAGRAILKVMIDIYRGLLLRIEEDPGAVLRGRVKLSGTHKMALALRALPTRYLARPPAALLLPDSGRASAF